MATDMSPERQVLEAYAQARTALKLLLLGMLPGLQHNGMTMTVMADAIADQYIAPLPVKVEVSSDHLVVALRACVRLDELVQDEVAVHAALIRPVRITDTPIQYGPARHHLGPQA